ncbi:DUF3152 domain-containing protein [Leekyejoonella antrihumi]|uniref:DUF3152 domain-containing protein n=1 Tax=Leekyejoonella antrihumi TaxID=1660198 RepID=A0A563E012_9MICO|nr:DUF3152 domain-containing protein [Leekyejoonella antrihumi]TWP35551.1 DUF3152 domain-containing protein [Leekyejoonella antrihumi]
MPPSHRPTPATSREVRLRRTVVGAVTLLALSSAMISYVRQSGAAAAGPRPAATSSHTTAPTATAPTGSATPAPSTRGPGGTPSPSSKPAPPSSTEPAGTTVAPVKVPSHGSGTFTRVLVPGPASTAKGRLVTYSLQVEKGMGANSSDIAKTVGSVLLDPRGWQSVDQVRFVQVTPQQVKAGTKPQVYITVASPQMTDKLCAPANTDSTWSCFNGGRAVLNYRRWADAVPSFKGNLIGYREYLINHEVGHGLGHMHQTCSKQGAPAPVMQEQSMGLHGCTAWFWPMTPSQAARAMRAATK